MGDRWRAGRSTGRTLWRDEVLVGMVDSPELAAEIVEAMEIRQRVGDRAAERWGERSPRIEHDPYDSTKGGVTGG